MTLSTSKYGHLKYTVVLADIVGLGAALTGDITLDTLPPGAFVKAAAIKATAALTGGSIATATAQLKINSTLLGPAATSVFTVAAEPAAALFQAAVGTMIGVSNLSSANTLKLTLTTTVGNLNAATSGQIDVVVDYSVLGF
jgi:hypothetical protein